ncbi:MAG: flagellar protein FliS, partial [Pseudomonadales bacterium]
RLLDANIKNDDAALDEVRDLLRELSEGWAGIPAEYRAQ